MVLIIQPGQRDIIFWSRVEFQADNAQLMRSTGANVSVMVLQDTNPPLRKADHLSLAIGDIVFGSSY